MKLFLFLLVLGYSSFIGGYQYGKIKYSPSLPIDYPEEMPGIGATPANPDTCIAYVKPGTDTIFVQYIPKPQPAKPQIKTDLYDRFGRLKAEKG